MIVNKPLVLVVAATEKGGIGKDGTVPWKLPIDMKFFRDVTSKATPPQQNAVIMGRKTFEAIPAKYRPLPNRFNIVITTNPNLKDHEDYKNACVCHSLDEAIQKANERDADQLFVIGGQQIYDMAMKHEQCKKILYTKIYRDFECDTFFPEMSELEWKCTEHNGRIEDNGVPIEFMTYERC